MKKKSSKSKHRKKKEEEKVLKPLAITSAAIKDDFCNYSYDITDGIAIGSSHNVKGSGLVKKTMHEAFDMFNAHLAYIDQAFKLSGIEVKSIDKMHNHELTANYAVSEFKIIGEEDNEAVILIGTKLIDMLGHIKITTPKVAIDKLSGYNFFKELKIAADKAREEVEAYQNGNFDIVEKPEKADPNQLTIADTNDDDFSSKE